MNPLTEAQATVLTAMGWQEPPILPLEGGAWLKGIHSVSMLRIDWNFTMGTVVPWALERGWGWEMGWPKDGEPFAQISGLSPATHNVSLVEELASTPMDAIWFALGRAVRSEGEQR